MEDNYTKIEQIGIIQKLKGTKFNNNFINLVNYVGEILDNGPVLREIGFTPHDFSHHVKDIYLLLDKMIPEGFYAKYNAGENLFVLLTGALFHDYGMIKQWNDEIRLQHSRIGRDLFREALANPDGVIKQFIELKYSVYIEDIIYAHSDIKAQDGTRVETFREICEKYENQDYRHKGEREEINVPFLAALVRLADELDITYERIENINYNQINNLPSSLQHFMLCEMFREVQISRSGENLTIVVDETKCNLQLLKKKEADISEDEILKLATQAANILERYEKIRDEFRTLNELVLRNTSYSSEEIWKIRKINLDKYDDLVEAAQKKKE